MLWDQVLAPISRVRRLTLQGDLPLKGVANQDEIWEKIQYESAYDHMVERLDEPMNVDEHEVKDELNEGEHHFVDLHLKRHWDQIRGWGERKWDQKFDTEHGKYWENTASRRNEMVAARNLKIASGELSYKACGNGLGAPRCNMAGEQIHEYYKGQKVA